MINTVEGGLSHLLYQHKHKRNNVKEKKGTTEEKRKNTQGRKNSGEENGN